MTTFRRFIGGAVRFLVLWLIDAFAVLVTVAILPGWTLTPPAGGSPLGVAAAVALLLGIVNLLIRPLILLLALPLGFFVLFIVGFFVNAVAVLIVDRILPGFAAGGLISATVGAFVFSIINTIVTSLISMDDQDSFYEGLVERLAMRRAFKEESGDGAQGATGGVTRGLLMVETDGLSYWHIQHALEQGYMPTLRRLMHEDGYVLSHVDCGLPSQTSACQAGIMYGDNFDIPAFRWYDKAQKKLFVSSKDAALLNERYAKGNGLMRKGSSINNMLNGDAAKSLLTLANMRTGTDEEKRQRAADIYLLMLNPYFFFRTIVLFIGDVILELYQGWKQRSQNVQPRLDRLHKFYPFVRASTTVFMRDIPGYLVILDLVRGSPAIYYTYVGYDEVAHHSGPWTTDAFGTLRQLDRVVARFLSVIEHKASRPYELILLSDHGQSFGATFKQRYGIDLKDYIESLLPKGVTVQQSSGGDDGGLSVGALSGELANMADQGMGGQVGKRVIKGAQRAAERGVEVREGAQIDISNTNVIAFGSGNLAQVYFDAAPRRLALSELDGAFPGMFDALLKHEGIGLIVAYDDDGVPIAHGKRGKRNLHTGEIQGEDPVLPYLGKKGTPELRAKQLRRVADFPNAGDLMVLSTVYPDGTVAALEELIGSHGGMGGEQTDAFIFHPGDMKVAETMNSADVFHILNARRGLHAPEKAKTMIRPSSTGGSTWKPANLARGLADVKTWVGYAARAAILDRSAYHAVAQRASMTGPGLLIGILAMIVWSLFNLRRFDLIDILQDIGLWLFTVLVTWIVARALGGRQSYTTTLRVTGFALAPSIVLLLGFIPGVAPLARILALGLIVMGSWIGVAEAHHLRGLRTILIPITVLLVLFGGAYVLRQLWAGAQLTYESLAESLGLGSK
jgi:uncharacterized membrane protein YvlD (DUF360 family)